MKIKNLAKILHTHKEAIAEKIVSYKLIMITIIKDNTLFIFVKSFLCSKYTKSLVILLLFIVNIYN